MDTSTKQKITKETQALNDTMDQVDLIDIYRAFHPKTMDFTFFSCVHGTSSRADHMLSQGESFSSMKICSHHLTWWWKTESFPQEKEDQEKTSMSKHFNLTQHCQSYQATKRNERYPSGSGKESACKAKDAGLIPGSGRSPGEGK